VNDMAAARGKAKTAAMKPRAKKATALVAYKAFNPDLSCNGFKYEVGKTYELGAEPVICQQGFHACEHPFDVFNYYPLGSRVARVTLSGKLDRRGGDDSKICGASITIDAELTVPDFVKAAVAWIVKAAKGNVATGYRGHAAATGYRGHAAATGYRGHAAATGYRGHAAATGDRGHAAATGEYGIAASLGPDGTATAGATGYIVLAHWDTSKWPYVLTRVERFKVGEGGVEPGKTYRLNKNGKPAAA
jgi:hypothetical protein